jgi:hypothetical protein
MTNGPAAFSATCQLTRRSSSTRPASSATVHLMARRYTLVSRIFHAPAGQRREMHKNPLEPPAELADVEVNFDFHLVRT